MWTKVTPSDAPPLYPINVQRLTRFFEFGLREPAMPSDVAQAIEEVIEADSPPFRVPVGRDANEVTAGRDSAQGDDWIDMLRTEGDDAFADAWQALVGRDYYRD